jgi:hypothetical protein
VQIFSKNLRASLFNDDLSNEPNSARSILLDSTFKLIYQNNLYKQMLHVKITKEKLALITGEKVGYLVAAEVEGLQAGVQVQLAGVHPREVVVGQVCA